jgi:hypothetical protein
VPVRIVARLGEQIEFVQKQASKRIPSAARRSICGVALMRLPYAPMACAAWSSAMMKTMFGRGPEAPAERGERSVTR